MIFINKGLKCYGILTFFLFNFSLPFIFSFSVIVDSIYQHSFPQSDSLPDPMTTT